MNSKLRIMSAAHTHITSRGGTSKPSFASWKKSRQRHNANSRKKGFPDNGDKKVRRVKCEGVIYGTEQVGAVNVVHEVEIGEGASSEGVVDVEREWPG